MAHTKDGDRAQSIQIVFKVFQGKSLSATENGEKAIRDGMTSTLNSVLDNAAKNQEILA